MLGWKLRPLPAYTVPRHILWQAINLKFGMLLRPKCWQLIQIWCVHTHTNTLTHTHTHCHPSSRVGMCCKTWSHNVYCIKREARGMAACHGLSTCIWMDIGCGIRTTETIWILTEHVKAWSNICTWQRNTHKHTNPSLSDKTPSLQTSNPPELTMLMTG